MPIFSDGFKGASVSTTETTVNIPKESVAVQVTNRGSVDAIISLGRQGQFSLTVPQNVTKAVDLTTIIQIFLMQGRNFDFGSDGFAGILTHRTASSTTTIDIEFLVAY